MRLIDAVTLKAEFTGNFFKTYHYMAIRAMIDIAPTIEAMPVVHGEWIRNIGCRSGEPAYYCNKCIVGESEFGIDNYCPNCGAKMDGGKE